MPPTKKYARQIKVNVGYFDWAFLEFVTQGSEQMLGDELRTALHQYQAKRPKLDRRAFMSWFEKEFVPKRLSDPADAESARSEVEHFFSRRDEDSQLRSPVLPSLELQRLVSGDPTAPDDED